MLHGKTNVESLLEMITNLPKNAAGIPLKKAFNPMALPQLLPYYLLGKMQRFGSVIVLIAGEKLDELFADSLKGADIFDIV